MKQDLKRVRRLAGQYSRMLMSLSFNIGGLAAGLLLATSLDVVQSVRWALLLYPSVLSAKGCIGGFFSGRLSTALHLGTVTPSLRGNTPYFYVLYKSIAFLTLLSAFIMWVFACGFGVLLIGLTTAEMVTMLVVTSSTMGLSLLIVSPLTVLISGHAMKKGFDPDVVTYPVVSTSADVLVTAVYLSVVFIHTSNASILLLTAFVGLLVVFSLKSIWAHHDEEVFKKTVKEFTEMILIVGFFVSIAGSALETISEYVTHQPHFYMVYPALIDTVGDVGSINGSTATTKLSLGLMDPSLKSIKDQSTEIASSWAASITIFIVYVSVTWLYFGPQGSLNIISYLTTILLTNFLSVSIIYLISFSLAIVTFTKGLDPDNFVIPIESTLADAITSLSLLAAILLIL